MWRGQEGGSAAGAGSAGPRLSLPPARAARPPVVSLCTTKCVCMCVSVTVTVTVTACHRVCDALRACCYCVRPTQARGISIKAMPMSLVMEGGSGKSYLLNLIDCPGVGGLDIHIYRWAWFCVLFGDLDTWLGLEFGDRSWGCAVRRALKLFLGWGAGGTWMLC